MFRHTRYYGDNKSFDVLGLITAAHHEAKYLTDEWRIDGFRPTEYSASYEAEFVNDCWIDMLDVLDWAADPNLYDIDDVVAYLEDRLMLPTIPSRRTLGESK